MTTHPPGAGSAMNKEPAPAVDIEDAAIAGVADIERRYRRHTLVRLFALVVATGMLLVLAVIAMALGTADIAPGEVVRAVLRLDRAEELSAEAARNAQIIRGLRLPRVVMAVVAGASLAVSGTVMQGLLRNVLVSPFTVGISSAAAFGASAAIVLGASVSGTGAVAIVSTAMTAALGCAGVVFVLSWARQMRPETVILVGVALAYLFSALTATLQFIATDEQIAEIVRWTFGTFNAATWQEVWVVLAMFVIGLPLVYVKSAALNALAFGGDDVARGLGVNIVAVRLGCGVLAVALTAVVISFTGVIGFVGLVAPHIARLIIGGDHRYLIPFSVLCGALLLLIADTVGRSLFAPVLIPVGIVVSYIGVPLFLNLVLSRRRAYF